MMMYKADQIYCHKGATKCGGSTNERDITFGWGQGSLHRGVWRQGERAQIVGILGRGTSMLNASRGGKVQDRPVQWELSGFIEV